MTPTQQPLSPYDRGFRDGLTAARVRTARARPVLQAGPVRFDRAAQAVTVSGRHVALSRTRRAILEHVMEAQGIVAPLDSLITRLWPMDEPTDPHNTLRAHIFGVRAALCAAGAPRDFILSVWGVGYRLNAAYPVSSLETN